ncbi:MAG: hypothetical protein AAF921_00045 [Cyanobacteria bacterium P01_D01_bin.44]
MSSEASRPPESTESTPTPASNPSADTPNTDAERPTLMGPPKRPEKPPEPIPPVATPPKDDPRPAKTAPEIVAINPAVASEPVDTDEPAASQDTEADNRPRQHPISPPSEPMQYRAIGLLRGRYCPSEENFNRGHILTQDDTQVSSVLLGRVTSLVKKHLEIESNHLWVVYPRTIADEDNALSVQIVGVWEPETLGVEDEEPEAQEPEAQESEAQEPEAQEPEAKEAGAEASDEAATATSVEATKATKATEAAEADEAEKADESVESDQPKSSDTAATETKSDTKPEVPPIPSDELQSDYFSIRGEIVKYVEDKAEIHINVLQKLRSNSKQRPFRLVLSGHLEGKTIGYFWDLNVERQAQHLVLTEGTQIAAVPPKKKKKGGRRGGPGGKRFSKGGPRGGGPRGGGSPRHTNERGDKAPPSRPTRSASSEVANADQS